MIPFDKNFTDVLIITIEKDEFAKINNPVILMNHLNMQGNGIITIVRPTITFSDRFSSGIKVKLEGPDNIQIQTFREYFDECYDSICDGMIGCAAWYASPLPALTSIAYCAISTR